MQCPKCKKTSKVYKNGFRPTWNKGKRKLVQAWICDNCGHQWKEN